MSAANDGFYAALNQMFTGDVAPMLKVWSHFAKVTDMGPFGERAVGWSAVRAEFEREAKMKMGGKVEPTHVLVRTEGSLGYVVCVEHGENLSPGGKPVRSISARPVFFVTRRADGRWCTITPTGRPTSRPPPAGSKGALRPIRALME